ncbi:MAG: 6-pyruvoyl-tetrahydropterin synthase-related protein [Candidatus Eisenbacteria bacterium]
MSERPPRVLSILGHPVTGVAPIAFLSAGWLLLALQVVPFLRQISADTLLAGGTLGVDVFWPLPPRILLPAVVGAGALFVGFVLFVVWVRSGGGFGPMADRLIQRKSMLAAIVLVAVGVLSAALLSGGVPTLGDAKTHIARGWLWEESIRASSFPRWSDLWFDGFPAGQHYPPLAHILLALLGFLRFDPATAAKVLAWLCLVAGSAGAALLCARLHRDPRSGLLGGLLYGLAPAFHAAWVWDGRLPGLLVLAILPWSFLVADRVSTGIGSIRSGAALALSIGALVLAHTGEARLALVLLGTFGILRVVSTAATRGERAPSIAGLLVGTVGGGLLAAAFIVPLAREEALLSNPIPASWAGLRVAAPRLGEIVDAFRWNPYGKGYLGLSTGLLAIGGIVRAAFDRKAGARGIGAIPLAILLVVPWLLVRPAGRGLDLVLFGGCLSAAGIVRRAPGSRQILLPRRIVFPLTILVVLLDLAPLQMVTTYGTHGEGRDRVYAALQGRLTNGRFLELPVDVEGRPHASLWEFAPTRPVPSVGGPFIQGAPRSFAYAAVLADTLAQALAAGRSPEPPLLDLLAFHGVRYVVLSRPTGPATLAGIGSRGFVLDPDVPAYRVEHASIVSVLQPGGPPPPPIPEIPLGVEGLPAADARRLVEEQIAWLEQARPSPVADARAVVLPNRLEVDLPDVGAATVRLARNDYPFTEVRLDGRAWPWEPAPLGGIQLHVDAGPHKLVVQGVESRLRRMLRLGQWALAGLLFLVGLGPRRG